VTWIHRASRDGDFYFIASASEQPVEITGTFRIQGQPAELWDPETGAIRPLDTFPMADGRTRAHIPLGPNGSAFVVFRAESPVTQPIVSIRRNGATVFPAAPVTGNNPEVEFTTRPDAERGALLHRSGDYAIHFADGGQKEFKQVQVTGPRAVTGPWTLTFPSDSGVNGPLTLDTLGSWSQHPDDNVKHFSGTAIYRSKFELPPLESRVVLDLGRVEVMAKVTVNGQPLGILWKPPYRLDITDAVKPGANTLEIAVVNLWVNRLIGDAALPDDAERDKNGRLVQWPDWVLAGQASPMGRRSFVTFPLWKKDEPLKESGLLGPVVLHFPVAVSLNGAKPATQPAKQNRASTTTARNN
jgi:hypothetical protein